MHPNHRIVYQNDTIHFHPAIHHQGYAWHSNAALFAANPAEKLPSLLVQAVVELGDKTDEGHIIDAVCGPWFEIIKLIRQDPAIAFRIDWRTWEKIVAGWYVEQGYEVTLTPPGGDHGRDIIAEKPGVLCVRFIDQIKAYKPGRLVDANDVRALLGVLGSDHNASKGIVTTTTDFAPMIVQDPFISRHIPNRLELVNGPELFKRLTAIANRAKSG